MLKHIRAILMLPFVVLVVIPILILALTNSLYPFFGQPLPVSLLLAALAIFLIVFGLGLIVSTIRLFMKVGEGTLSPLDPTRRLVVLGPYRYVRNPMITGVLSILIGETLLTGSIPILIWTLFNIILNLTYIPLLEEPGLYQRFGDDYRHYVQNVPRWIPRRTPWTLT